MSSQVRRKIYENAVIARMMGIMQQQKVIDFVVENTEFSYTTVRGVIRDNWDTLDKSAEDAEHWMNETIDHWIDKPPNYYQGRKPDMSKNLPNPGPIPETEEDTRRKKLEQDQLKRRQDQEKGAMLKRLRED